MNTYGGWLYWAIGVFCLGCATMLWKRYDEIDDHVSGILSFGFTIFGLLYSFLALFTFIGRMK